MGRFPFPQNQRLPGCSYPSQADAADVRLAFLRFREEIVTADGARGFLRTRRPDTPDGAPNSTVSEGIAYGMIIAVMFDDQALFDALWSYALAFLNTNGLMSWYIAPDGSEALGHGGATDSDEDMAWALVMAHRQWGGRGALSECSRCSCSPETSTTSPPRSRSPRQLKPPISFEVRRARVGGEAAQLGSHAGPARKGVASAP